MQATLFLSISISILWIGVFGDPDVKSIARIETRRDSLAYLVKYGYFGNVQLIDLDKLDFFQTNEAINRFQEYADLNKTGVLDNGTLLKMNQIRCGNRDIPVEEFGEKPKPRYRLTGGKWPNNYKRTLTWRITRYPRITKMSKKAVEQEIHKAFQTWADVTNLKFLRSSKEKVDFEVSFEDRRHGDGNDFDGNGIVLAHAYGPPLRPEYEQGLNGDVHFDNEEVWTLKGNPENQQETDLLPVAVHEIGHALGLGHSEVRSSIMYAFMTATTSSNFKLHRDDIRGIQELYGVRKNKTSNANNFNESEQMRPASINEICKDPRFDAILTLNQTIYAFRDGDYIRFGSREGRISIEEIDRIGNQFEGLPSGIDAALNYNDEFYFFKDEDYWKFNKDLKMDQDFPKNISQDFPGVPGNIDAVLNWEGDSNIYFFKGEEYWAFNSKRAADSNKVTHLPISHWGLSNNISSAFQSPNGFTFFFKENNYWRFDEETFSIAQAEPAYPRLISHMWLGCHNFRPEFNELV